jgi:adhesin transport system outer membrane protein
VKKLLKLTIQIGFLTTFSLSVHAEKLNEVIEQAILTNPSILEQYNQKISREYEVKVANAGYLPSVDFDAGGGYNRTESDATKKSKDGDPVTYSSWVAGFALKQMLFDGFLTSSEKARQLKRVESAFFEQYKLAEGHGVKTFEVFFNVLR